MKYQKPWIATPLTAARDDELLDLYNCEFSGGVIFELRLRAPEGKIQMGYIVFSLLGHKSYEYLPGMLGGK